MGLDPCRLNLIGQSGLFLAALQMLERLAACEATVLIQGEIGTGKEVAARAIHYLGSRRDGFLTTSLRETLETALPRFVAPVRNGLPRR